MLLFPSDNKIVHILDIMSVDKREDIYYTLLQFIAMLSKDNFNLPSVYTEHGVFSHTKKF